jgi:tRNA 2-thiocytidine biosynthesis protein TtcA
VSQLRASLLRRISRLNRQFPLIEAGDVVMVACSGGKDSWALLHLLRAYQRVVPFGFELVAMNLDQGHPGFDVSSLRDHLESHGFRHELVRDNTHDVVVAQTPAGKIFCSRCSRMRRAILHATATRIGANKIALGHHRDDAIETLWLNMMYAGRLRAMPALLPGQSGGAAVIRPVLGCAEQDLGTYAAQIQAPILPCDLCGSQPNTRRQRVKQWLAQLETEVPDLRANMLAALGNVEPGHLLDPRVSASPPEAAAALPGDEHDEHDDDLAEATAEPPLVRIRRAASRIAAADESPA